MIQKNFSSKDQKKSVGKKHFRTLIQAEAGEEWSIELYQPGPEKYLFRRNSKERDDDMKRKDNDIAYSKRNGRESSRSTHEKGTY